MTEIDVDFFSFAANFQEVFVCVLPFFHIYGMVAVMLVGFDLGAKLVTLPRFDTDSFLNTVHLHHVRFDNTKITND